MRISDQEQSEINELVTRAEARSGGQILVVIVAKADAYPEIPWKAFAVGAALGALLTVAGAFQSQWAGSNAAVESAVVLAAGAVPALLTVFIPGFARFFLSRPRAQAEVRQYAKAVFLERGVFQTRDRVGVLILIARFEREVVVLADVGIGSHVAPGQIDAVASQMKPLLGRRGMPAVCQVGLNALEVVLKGRLAQQQQPVDELAVTVVEERGA